MEDRTREKLLPFEEKTDKLTMPFEVDLTNLRLQLQKAFDELDDIKGLSD